MSEDCTKAWYEVFDTCISLGLKVGQKQYVNLCGRDKVCLFIRNLARRKLRKQAIQRLTRQCTKAG
jgi:hypothetical protein